VNKKVIHDKPPYIENLNVGIKTKKSESKKEKKILTPSPGVFLVNVI